MKRILFLSIVFLMSSVVSAQDCFEPLFNKGITEYKAGNYDKAIIKWQGALDCPDLTKTNRDTLNHWIVKAKNPPPPFKEPEMVFVQGGTFKMGSEEGNDDEEPIHSVTLKSFHISKYEITVAQFAVFIQETAYITTAEKEDSSRIWRGSNQVGVKWKWKRSIFWKHDEFGYLQPQPKYNYPVIHVSWHDATVYCEWLSRKTGKKYRLPTEAEWEYAARGGNKSKGYKYSGSNTIEDVAWYSANSSDKTHPVGTKRANELGLFDMSGNVEEWCHDWDDSYPNNAATNPTGAASGEYRIIRGGSWAWDDDECRIAYRNFDIPLTRYYNVGFRIARYD